MCIFSRFLFTKNKLPRAKSFGYFSSEKKRQEIKTLFAFPISYLRFLKKGPTETGVHVYHYASAVPDYKGHFNGAYKPKFHV